MTPNGKFAYTGNAGSSSISQYQVGRDGSLALGEAAAGVTGNGTGVTDLAMPRSGQRCTRWRLARCAWWRSKSVPTDG